MSQPKRYSVAVDDPWFGDGAYITEDGKYVLHSDYAALAAENERLKAIIVDECYGSDAYRKHENEAKRLTAENERLRKAGDRLHDALVLMHKYGAELHPSIWAWDAAKEGRDAK